MSRKDIVETIFSLMATTQAQVIVIIIIHSLSEATRHVVCIHARMVEMHPPGWLGMPTHAFGEQLPRPWWGRFSEVGKTNKERA